MSVSNCWYGWCCDVTTYFTHKKYTNDSSMNILWERDRGYHAKMIVNIAGKLYTCGNVTDGHGVERWAEDGSLELNFPDPTGAGDEANFIGARFWVAPDSSNNVVSSGIKDFTGPDFTSIWRFDSSGSVVETWQDGNGGDHLTFDSTGLSFIDLSGVGRAYNVDRSVRYTLPSLGGAGIDTWAWDRSNGNAFQCYQTFPGLIASTVKKFNSAGVLQWTRFFPDADPQTIGSPEDAISDGVGGVYIAGQSRCIHLDAAGATVHSFAHNANVVFCDAYGNVYFLNGGRNLNVLKYNSADVLQFFKTVTWGNASMRPDYIWADNNYIYLAGNRATDG